MSTADAWPALQIVTPADWSAIGSELAIVVTIVANLIVPFFVSKRLTSAAVTMTALVGVAAALLLTCLRPMQPGSYFDGLLLSDAVGRYWNILLLSFVFVIIIFWYTAVRERCRESDDVLDSQAVGDTTEPPTAPERFTLLLASVVGMMLMGSTANLLMVLLALELASMPSYVLAGFDKFRRRSSEASLKFVLFGAVCTAAMIYGISLLYGLHHSLSIAQIATSISQSDSISPLTIIGLLAVGVGIFFKISAVPWHAWCPDVFQAAPTDVTAFLAAASKGAGVMLLMRVLALLTHTTPSVATGVAAVVGVLAVLTMTVGNLGALRQTSVKRLLAYSSIAHAGYLLAGVAVIPLGLVAAGTTAVEIYLAVYLVMTLIAFAVVAAVEAVSLPIGGRDVRKIGLPTAAASRDADHIDNFNGLATRSPFAAAAMTAALLSMVGLPPFVGLLAKWKIMSVLAQAGGIWWFVLVAVALNSVVSLGYYARIIRAMYLRPLTATTAENVRQSGRARTSPAVRRLPTMPVIIAVAGAAMLVLMLVFFAALERAAAGAAGYYQHF